MILMFLFICYWCYI